MVDTHAATTGSGTVSGSSANPLIESDRVEGTSVYGSDASHVGTVKRLMIDKKSGQVAYAVMSFGGFLGLGEDTFTIPWGTLTYDTDLGGYRTNISPEQLQKAPSFEDDYDWSNRERENALHAYYGVSPYWGL